jgi:hypothetical protein
MFPLLLRAQERKVEFGDPDPPNFMAAIRRAKGVGVGERVDEML